MFTSVSRSRIHTLVVLIGLGLPFLAAACSQGGEKPPPVEAGSSPEEREKKATALWLEAESADPARKLELYRKVIAVYPDTKRAQEVYLSLVVYLVRETPPLLDEALRHSKAYADRHPTDLRWSECFLQVTDTATYTKDATIRAAALSAWSQELEKHDVAADIPKIDLLPDLAGVRIRQERWQDADVALDSALGETTLPPARRVELLVRQGDLRGFKLGKKTEARACFDQALELSKALQVAGTKRAGYAPEDIQGEIKKLDG